MANLSKLDETIDQLEKQAEMLKRNNNVLTKVSELSTVIEKGVAELSTGNKNFEGTKKDLQDSLQLLSNSLVDIQKQNEKHIDTIVSSNKKFLGELDDSISSKLKRFSSDIEVTIRQERSQLQEALQTSLTAQFNLLGENQKKQISLLRNLVIAGSIINVGLLVLLYFK